MSKRPRPEKKKSRRKSPDNFFVIHIQIAAPGLHIVLPFQTSTAKDRKETIQQAFNTLALRFCDLDDDLDFKMFKQLKSSMDFQREFVYRGVDHADSCRPWFECSWISKKDIEAQLRNSPQSATGGGTRQAMEPLFQALKRKVMESKDQEIVVDTLKMDMSPFTLTW